jgi:glutamate racemase
VILACNTASAAALRRMQEHWVPKDKRVLGVFVPLIEALTERRWGDNSPPREVAVKHVALFATPATVASRAFQRELAFRAIGVDVEAQSCGGVVDAIEEGDLILAEALVRSHVDALKRKMPRPEAAILGCTHYPLMQDVFQDALGPEVQVYSARRTSWPKALPTTSRGIPACWGRGPMRFLTTGDPRRVSDKADAVPATTDRFRGRLIAARPERIYITVRTKEGRAMSSKVAILGASGYTGAELVRLIATHPTMEIAALSADRKAGRRWPRSFRIWAPGSAAASRRSRRSTFRGVDMTFCALPHATSQEVIARCRAI